MARLNVLEYPAEFLRGWPHGEAVEMNYPSATQFGNGDLVQMNTAGQFIAATANQAHPITIARGQNDTFDQGGTGTGNLYTQVVPNIGIMSNYVVRTSVVGSGGTNDVLPIAGSEVGIGIHATSNAPVWCAISGTVTVAAGVCLEIETGLTDVDGNAIANVATILVK